MCFITATRGGSSRWLCVHTVKDQRLLKGCNRVSSHPPPKKKTLTNALNFTRPLNCKQNTNQKMKSNIREQICKLSQQQNTTQQREGTIIKIKTKCSPISDSRGDKSNYLHLMLQICSNGRSEKVNKRLRRGNKRMWFLINLKEEQQGDLVNPSFICCLRPLVCLLHNVVFKRAGGELCLCVCAPLPSNEMSTDLTAPQKDCSVFQRFVNFIVH